MKGVHPPNRRVARQQLPPDVLEVSPDRTGDSSAPPRVSRAWLTMAWRVSRVLFGVVLVVGLAGSVAWLARGYVRSTPRFAVSEIVVTGNKRRSAEDVATFAGIEKGANVFLVDLERARQKLLTDPWVKTASLSRVLPGTIHVSVTEREAAALVATPDLYLVTREGEAFKRFEAGDPSDLPIITGFAFEQMAQDREAAAQTIRRAIDVASEYDAHALSHRSPLQEVRLGPASSIHLVVGKAAVTLALGGPPFRRKLDQAHRVLLELDRRGAKASMIMLDNDTRPERVVARVR